VSANEREIFAPEGGHRPSVLQAIAEETHIGGEGNRGPGSYAGGDSTELSGFRAESCSNGEDRHEIRKKNYRGVTRGKRGGTQRGAGGIF